MGYGQVNHNQNSRFSLINNIYYQSYYDHDILQDRCCILLFSTISDIQLIYQISVLESNQTQLKMYKGNCFLDTLYKYKTCFNLDPPFFHVDHFCFKEIGNTNANFIIITDKMDNYFNGFIINVEEENNLYERILYYNNTIIQNKNCFKLFF